MTEIELQDWIDFALAHPFAQKWPESQIRRFVNDLTSSPEFVYRVSDEHGKACLAVLVDRINNRGNDAILEVIGMRPGAREEEILAGLLTTAKLNLIHERDGIEMTFPQSKVFAQNFTHQNQMNRYYDAFDMRVENFPQFPAEIEVEEPTSSDDREFHALVKASFAESLDASIPDFDTWLKARKAANPETARSWITREGSKIIGYLNLGFAPELEPEVRTVGVDAAYRGRGIGRRLIEHALNFLRKRNQNACTLTVSAQNENALALYESLGFRETGRTTVYRWARNRP